MKFEIFVVSVLIYFTCNIAGGLPLDKGMDDCITELGLNRDEILKIAELEFPPDNNNDYSKFVECDSKKKGLMTSSGEVLFSELNKLLIDTSGVKHLSYFLQQAYKMVISTVVHACEGKPLTNSNPGVNMIHARTCLHRELKAILQVFL